MYLLKYRWSYDDFLLVIVMSGGILNRITDIETTKVFFYSSYLIGLTGIEITKVIFN